MLRRPILITATTHQPVLAKISYKTTNLCIKKIITILLTKVGLLTILLTMKIINDYHRKDKSQ